MTTEEAFPRGGAPISSRKTAKRKRHSIEDYVEEDALHNFLFKRTGTPRKKPAKHSKYTKRNFLVPTKNVPQVEKKENDWQGIGLLTFKVRNNVSFFLCKPELSILK
jgi:hypothetical protein